MLNPMSLEHKKIIITGASSGIGRATAIYCSKLGAQVVLMGREKHRLKETYNNMNGLGHIICIQDFDDDINFDNVFNQITNDGVKLDGLVHCAGVTCTRPIKMLSRDKLESVMNINFYSFVELARIFTKRKYSNDYASIIGISSSVVLHPRMYEMGYVVSKAAMEISIPIMAQEFWKRKIRVNGIAPGNVRTEMIFNTSEKYGNKEILDNIASSSIIGWQKPEDISKVCAFMLSDASSTITAKIIRADGGYV